MANATPSRLGQQALAGDALALFLKVFTGEVLARFSEVNVMMPRHEVRTIQSGKSAQFVTIGNFTAGYHTPGVELLGEVNNTNERIITINKLLTASAFVDKLDEAMSQYDVRGSYASKLAEALSDQADEHLLQIAILAARAAGLSGSEGGSVVTLSEVTGATSFDTVPADLLGALFVAAQTMDEKRVSKRDRYAFIRPAQFYKLVQATTALNKDWGGVGSFAAGTLPIIAGFNVVPSTHIPSTDLSADVTVATGSGAEYAGDFTGTTALCMQKEAIGTVKLLDMSMENAWDFRRRGTLLIAEYAMGHGILRPECSVEIRNVA